MPCKLCYLCFAQFGWKRMAVVCVVNYHCSGHIIGRHMPCHGPTAAEGREDVLDAKIWVPRVAEYLTTHSKAFRPELHQSTSFLFIAAWVSAPCCLIFLHNERYLELGCHILKAKSNYLQACHDVQLHV